MNLIKKYSLETLDKLVIETSKGNYAVRKNEEEGVKDLRELVLTSKLEGAWAYLPNEELWVWVAKGEPQPEKKVLKEGKPFVVVDVEPNLYFIFSTLFKQDLIIYHFHTADHTMMMEFREKELRELMPNIEDFLVEMFKENYQKELSFRAALPFGDDISMMTNISKKFYWANPFGKISHKVCSEHGVSEFYLTEEGRNFFNHSKVLFWNRKKFEENGMEKLKQFKELHKIEKETNEKINHLPLESKLSSEEAIKSLIKEIKHPYFEVVFTPYD